MAEQERLTARDPVGNAYFPECFKEPCGGGGCTKDHCVFLDSVCDKLAGYEEQGDQTEKLLAESEAARAEPGRRLADAQRELADAQRELADAQRELETADRNAEILAAELLDIKVCLVRKADYIRMNFGYSPQLSHEALQKAVWYTARRIVEEDRRMREERGETDRDYGSLEQYFISHGFHGVPKDETEKIRLVTTVTERISGLSAEGCQALAKVCRRFLERMDERNGR